MYPSIYRSIFPSLIYLTQVIDPASSAGIKRKLEEQQLLQQQRR